MTENKLQFSIVREDENTRTLFDTYAEASIEQSGLDARQIRNHMEMRVITFGEWGPVNI